MELSQIRVCSRTEVRTVACPACTASPGKPCWGRGHKPREANHAERVQTYLDGVQRVS